MLPRDRMAWQADEPANEPAEDRPGTASAVIPHFVDPSDRPWIERLLDEARTCDGRPQRALEARLDAPLAPPARRARQRMVAHVLGKLARPAPPQRPRARAVRARVFEAATMARRAGPSVDRNAVLTEAGRSFDLDADTVEGRLFADLVSERSVRLPESLPDAVELAARTNLALVQSLLFRAESLSIRLEGHSHAVVRQAHLRRLICTARRDGRDGIRLDISGARCLFRRTTMYGRALASLVPVLQWCRRFDLRATCQLDGHAHRLSLASGAPIFPSRPIAPFDSKLEARFAGDFARCAGDAFELIREPSPVEASGTLIFPDFAIRCRDEPDHQWWVELVGFWTADYLRSKLDRLRAAGLEALILCVDDALHTGDADFPPTAHVLRYRRRVDVARVLEIARQRPPRPPAPVSLGIADLFVDFAGRRPPDDPTHAALATLRPGDAITLEPRGRFVVVCAGGQPITALSARARQRWHPHLAEIRAVTVRDVEWWGREQSGEAWRNRLRVDRWRVPHLDLHI